MPPRPFPYPLSIGTDIAHTVRIRRAVAPTDDHGKPLRLFRFMKHFLTYREQQHFWARFSGAENALGPHLDRVTQYLAGRWAAKEAVIKAVHWRRLSFKHIQILRRNPDHIEGGPLYALILDQPASSRPNPSVKDHAQSPAGAEQSNTEHASDSESHLGHPDVATDWPSAQRPRDPTEDGHTPAELQNDGLPGQTAQISISHDGEYATAVCLAAEEPSAGDVGGEASAREP
ncbi:hypothetical protein LTR85_008693 [Meristemomyces frigidus]|nr:hypothetical protein LTR85_008693 [Meristemomyces frigidus]